MMPEVKQLFELGIYLGIREESIISCRVNNQDSHLAMYDLLYRRWYKSQDADWLRKNGRKRLCDVLRHPNVGQNYLVASVIDEHFKKRQDSYSRK